MAVFFSLMFLFCSCFKIKRYWLQFRCGVWLLSSQYSILRQREHINSLIEDAILEAEEKGTTMLTLGLHNQEEEVNGNGELFIRRNPQLKVKLVDGSSLAVAVVLNSIPKGTTQVSVRGNLSKVSSSIAIVLCQKGTQVSIPNEDEYIMLKEKCGTEAQKNLTLSKDYSQKIWLVGDGVGKAEQMKATKGTIFIQCSDTMFDRTTYFRLCIITGLKYCICGDISVTLPVLALHHHIFLSDKLGSGRQKACLKIKNQKRTYVQKCAWSIPAVKGKGLLLAI